jgi:hypothetical protein
MSKESMMKLRESVILETAWLYATIDETDEEKEKMIDFTKAVWNRSIGRAGFAEHFQELSFDEEEIKEAAKYFSASEISVN